MNRLMKILAMGMLPEDACLYKGGKGSAPKPQPIIPPSAPVQDASVELETEDDENKTDKNKSSKSSLKVPLEISEKAGLSNVSSGGTTGLKV